MPWKRVALASAVVLVLGLVGITVIEAVTGQPLASLSGNEDANGTTVGNAVNPDDRRDNTSEDPGKDDVQEPEPGGDTTEAPSEDAEPTDEASPTEEPSDGTQPSDEPTG